MLALVLAAQPLSVLAAAQSSSLPTNRERSIIPPAGNNGGPPTRDGLLTPASSAVSPTGFGAGWGDVFAGVNLAQRARFGRPGIDGTAAIGFGLGNPGRNLGMQITVHSYSTGTGLGKRGAIDLKVHRRLPGGLALGVGVESIGTFGDAESPRSWFGVATKWLTLRDGASSLSQMVVTAGLGGGRFRTEHDWSLDRDTVGIVCSVSMLVVDQLSLIVDWTGQDLVLATSVVPSPRIPLLVTYGLVDVLGTAGDGVRFSVGATLGGSLTGGT